ncbi:hypothetical protein OG266_34300 [Streptomyces sp. NBC_00554]|uniref:hypothetical protein n=1 Tax=Streptomyces sp. NBC_00554 TaxID=2903661 RepID=UPI00352D6924|nr:hypothetical protein OG266_34300 [Streptomyces sp. NBC_00554]
MPPAQRENVTVRDHRRRRRFIRGIERKHGPTRRTQSVARILSARAILGVDNDNAFLTRRPLANEVPGDVTQVGDQPAGFGVLIDWNTDEDMAVIAFINAMSIDGVMVSGVRDGDTFELERASGRATFDVGTDNEAIPGLISIAAVGANIAAGAFGQPELIPLINAASTFAQQRFPETSTRGRARNAFGEDDNGGRARQEGGVIVCNPSARAPYTSGDEDHQSRWIQGNGQRISENLPDHISAGSAFFLRRDMGSERIQGTGEMTLSAWDHGDFAADNSGFYRVRFILRRDQNADDDEPVVE